MILIYSVFKRTIHPPPQNVNVFFFFFGGGAVKIIPHRSGILLIATRILHHPLHCRVKVLYDYEAQDLDELTIKEGELVELVKEGFQFLGTFFSPATPPFLSDESGWWTGKVGGKEGFFPGAYVEKV